MMSQNAPASRWIQRGGALLVCLLLTGCASKGKVSGRVTYQGKPIPQGTVLFLTEKGQTITGIITDGQYEVKDIVPGMAKIAVQTPNRKVSISSSGGMGGAPKPPPGVTLPKGFDPSAFDMSAQLSKVQVTSIPEKYRDPDQSGLTCMVKGGAQVHDIDLK